MGFLISACGLTSGQKSTLTQFGNSATSYGTTVASITGQTQDNVDLMRERGLEMPTATSARAFEESRKSGIWNYIHNPDARAHIVLVNALASSIKSYGDALTELANYGDPAARSKTFVDIADQLDAALTMPVAKTQADFIGQAIGFVSNQVLEAVKKQDIKAIVAAYQPGIASAAKLIGSEFDGQRPGTVFFEYKNTITIYDNRIPDLLALQIGVGSSAPEANNRQLVIDSIKLLETQKAAYTDLRKKGMDASTALVKANDALATTMQSDAPSVADITDFVKQAEALYQAYKASK